VSAYLLDTETTGITEPVVAVEIAWQRLDQPDSLTALAEYSQRFNPGRPIDLGAMATHHIMDEDVAQCAPASDYRLPADAVWIIGHNVDYDWRVLGEPPVKRICTLALSRHFWPAADSHTLGAMLYLLHREYARLHLRDAHSALADVKVLRIVLRYIVERVREKVGGAIGWETLWQVSEVARVPTVMTFGKHKGMAIRDVPADYKRWLLSQPDVDPYLAQALRS